MELRERAGSWDRPYKDRTIAEREIADLVAAGSPELLFGDHSKAGDRLTAEEIKVLTFGHTRSGRNVKSEPPSPRSLPKTGLPPRLAAQGRKRQGSCTSAAISSARHWWTDWGPSCGAVFRNPGGTPEHQDEYILVDGWSEYHFSIVK